MPASKPYAATRLTSYLEKRVLELRPVKSQAEIAGEAGFTNPNMISMIKSGATRIPLDRVPALAESLDVDPARLLQLALEQWAGSATARLRHRRLRPGDYRLVGRRQCRHLWRDGL